MAKRIITEADINKAVESGQKVLECEAGSCIITAQAQDKALLLGVEIALVEAGQVATAPAVPASVVEVAVPAVEPVAPVQTPEPVAPVTPAQPVATPAQSETDVLISEVCGIILARLDGSITEQALETIVRRVVNEKLYADPAESNTANAVDACPGGVCVIDGSRLVKQGDNHIAVDEQVFIADALGECPGAELAAGYMEWCNASFTRTVECAEVAVVISGELQLTMSGKTVTAKAGDTVYLPEGVDVLYSTTSSVRLACINNVA